jgi:hypothetical protein
MPTRLSYRRLPSAPQRLPRVRPWPALPPQARAQLAQQVAHLLQRLREEGCHAERTG